MFIQFSQERDFTKAGTQIIVHVPRDAKAFLGKRELRVSVGKLGGTPSRPKVAEIKNRPGDPSRERETQRPNLRWFQRVNPFLHERKRGLLPIPFGRIGQSAWRSVIDVRPADFFTVNLKTWSADHGVRKAVPVDVANQSRLQLPKSAKFWRPSTDQSRYFLKPLAEP